MEATFKHGDPLFVDYTPGSAVDAGDVVVIDSVPHVALATLRRANSVLLRLRRCLHHDRRCGDRGWRQGLLGLVGVQDHHFDGHRGKQAFRLRLRKRFECDGDPIVVVHAPDGTAI